MDGGAWWAAVHGVAKSRTRLSEFTFHFSLSRIGEGNGNPLQCSCLENPRDGGAWWADVFRVAQSRTRLKWLSSSSNYSPECLGPATRMGVNYLEGRNMKGKRENQLWQTLCPESKLETRWNLILRSHRMHCTLTGALVSRSPHPLMGATGHCCGPGSTR